MSGQSTGTVKGAGIKRRFLRRLLLCTLVSFNLGTASWASESTPRPAEHTPGHETQHSAEVVGLVLVSSKNHDAHTADNTYKVRIRNRTPALTQAIAHITHSDRDIVVLQGSVQLGELPANQMTLSRGTITLREKRHREHEHWDREEHRELKWSISGVPTMEIASASIPSGGGTVSLRDIGSVQFAAGAFGSKTQVTLEATADPQFTQEFEELAAIFQPGAKMTHELRVVVPQQPQAPGPVVSMQIPNAVSAAVTQGDSLRVFVRVFANGGEDELEAFNILDSTIDATTQTIRFRIPDYAFTAEYRNDGQLEAVVTLAPTPGIASAPFSATSTGAQTAQRSVQTLRSALVTADASTPTLPDGCPTVPLSCPIEGGCTVTSKFDPNGRTLKGVTEPHLGVDYLAATDTNVLAAQAGIVDEKTLNGYGTTLIIRAADGSSTVYGHLDSFNVANGVPVKAGDVIALSDNSGRSTGPHLHFEYVTKGGALKIKKTGFTPAYMDPESCRGPATPPPPPPPVPVLVLGLSPSSAKLAVGNTVVLTASALDQNTGQPLPLPANLQWSSSEPAVAVVSGTGGSATVSAIAAGNASISVTDPVSTQSASAAITVTAETVTSYAGTLSGTLPLTGFQFACSPGPLCSTNHVTFGVTIDSNGNISVIPGVFVTDCTVCSPFGTSINWTLLAKSLAPCTQEPAGSCAEGSAVVTLYYSEPASSQDGADYCQFNIELDPATDGVTPTAKQGSLCAYRGKGVTATLAADTGPPAVTFTP